MSRFADDLNSLNDFKKKAIKVMSFDALKYIMASADGDEDSQSNEDAFKKYRIHPLMLRDVSQATTETTLLGEVVSFPVGLAPVAHKHLVHSSAEIASAAAAYKEGCPFILSCKSIGDVQGLLDEAPTCNRWLQLYIFKDRSLVEKLVRTAETSGFSALVVTVDSPVSGQWKFRVPQDLPVRLGLHHEVTGDQPKMFKTLLDASLTFQDLKWLKSITKLPVVVKGILTGSDAVRSLRTGASAVIVSNHGGRQINGVCPTIDVLSEVVDAVKSENSQAEVYLDGGIRTGSDVFRALAIGARAVFIGRPVVWGLTVGGEEGVRRVLQLLKDEFLSTMQLAGAKNPTEIVKSMISTSKCCCHL